MLFLAYVVCVWSPLFQIRRIVVMPTVQVSSAQVSELAAIPAGSTLFGFDESGVEKRLLANPWIKSVRLTRNLQRCGDRHALKRAKRLEAFDGRHMA